MSACDDLLTAIHKFGKACIAEGTHWGEPDYMKYKEETNKELEKVYAEIIKYRDSLISEEVKHDN